MKFRSKLVTTIAVLATTFLISGCPRQTDVYNVKNAQVVANIESTQASDVRKAIIRAGGGLGWVIQDSKPNVLEGTLNLRSHMAKIEIPYSNTSYSILYKDSTGLDYDGTKIHGNYNGWIQNLQKAIQVQLNTL